MLDLREEAIKYAYCYIGDWYMWGGDTPDGYDCSGFVCEILKSVDKIGRNEDLTAQGLYERFQGTLRNDAQAGCLVLYQNNEGKIIHVEFMVDSKFSIGASGGGSNTITKADAIRDKAFIKKRSAYSRNNIFGFVDPFYDTI